MIRIFKKLLKLLLLAAVLTILCQNPLIFPGAPHDFWFPVARIEAPQGVESGFVNTLDGDKLEFWRLAKPTHSTRKQVALILHGNFGDLGRFFYIQEEFRSIGITSYDIDYRGYGRSTGWPTEEGLYQDAEALWNLVMEREKILPEDIIVVGVSLGSGPASYLAEKYHPRALLLVAPYTSIPEVVRDRPVLGLLSPFVWIHFPNVDRMKHLSDVCVVSAHGEKDRKINIEHSRRLQAAYGVGRGFHFISHPEADHNSILRIAWPEVSAAVLDCFSDKVLL